MLFRNYLVSGLIAIGMSSCTVAVITAAPSVLSSAASPAAIAAPR